MTAVEVRVPRFTGIYARVRGRMFMSVESLELLLAECELANDDEGVRAFLRLLRSQLREAKP